MSRCWQIQLTFPDRVIKTHVYSDTGKDIANDRFRQDLCTVLVIGEIDDPLKATTPKKDTQTQQQPT